MIPSDLSAPPGDSVSVGVANRGRLFHGVELRESDVMRFVSGRDETRFTTAEFAAAVERAARAVATDVPGSMLAVGAFSRESGGRARPHRSHQNGRDADLGFYVTDGAGNPTRPHGFTLFGADGLPRRRRARGRGQRPPPPPSPIRFDDRRNWTFVAALLSDPEIRVQYIFIADPLRDRLLREAERCVAPPALIEKASIVLQQPRRGSAHRDHFHVRIYCDRGDRPYCVDSPPYWPWFDGPAAGSGAPIEAE